MSPTTPDCSDFYSLLFFSSDGLGFLKDRVSVVFDPQLYDACPCAELKVEDVWQRKLSAAAKTGAVLYNKSKFRLAGFSSQNGSSITLRLGLTDYKQNIAVCALSFEQAASLDPSYLAPALGCELVWSTREGKVVFMQRSEKVASYPGWAQCAGSGHPEPDNVEPEKFATFTESERIRDELFSSALSEVEAETGVARANFSKPVLLGGVSDEGMPGSKPDVVFSSQCDLTEQEVKSCYAKLQEIDGEKFESTRLIFLSIEEVKLKILQSTDDVWKLTEEILGIKVTPATRGALELWMRYESAKKLGQAKG